METKGKIWTLLSNSLMKNIFLSQWTPKTHRSGTHVKAKLAINIKKKKNESPFIRDVFPGSRMPDPDFHQTRIPDAKWARKERADKFYVYINLYKFDWSTKEKNVGQFSGILKKAIPDPEVNRHQNPDPQHCFYPWRNKKNNTIPRDLSA